MQAHICPLRTCTSENIKGHCIISPYFAGQEIRD